MSSPTPGFLRRRSKFILGASATAATAVVLYKLYQSGVVGRSNRALSKLRAALSDYSTALLAGSHITATIAQDLEAYLASDQQQLPQSLRQLSRLLQSPEVQQSTSKLTAAVIAGLASACKQSVVQQQLSTLHGAQRASTMSALDKVLAAMLSEKGHSLVSLAVGVAARNATTAYCDCIEQSAAAAAAHRGPGALAETTLDQLLRFAATPAGERLCMACVSTFVTHGTQTYLDKVEGTNQWKDFFGALTTPQNRGAAEHMTRAFVNELVRSYWNPKSSPARPQQESQPPSPASAVSSESSSQEQDVQQQLPSAARRAASVPAVSHSPSRAQAGRGNPSSAHQRADSQPGLPPRSEAQTLQRVNTAVQQHGPEPTEATGVPTTVAKDGAAQQSKPGKIQALCSMLKQSRKVVGDKEARLLMLSVGLVGVTEFLRAGYQAVKSSARDNMAQAAVASQIAGLSVRHVYVILCFVVLAVMLMQHTAKGTPQVAVTV